MKMFLFWQCVLYISNEYALSVSNKVINESSNNIETGWKTDIEQIMFTSK